MRKYFAIFSISFQQEFAYRLNFVMWRVRNVLQIFLVFFLWDTVFSDPNKVIFGYDRSKILTYVFAVLVLKSIILASRAQDIAGEISRGDLSNYLLKPINYIKYWFIRDISSKALNFGFAIVEIVLLYLLLKPTLYFPGNPLHIVLFLAAVVLAVIIYFLLLVTFASFPFWFPENAWGMSFLLIIFTELLGGVLFPIDILPTLAQKIILLTPFPYLIFIPIQIYLEKLTVVQSLTSLSVALVWIAVLVLAVQKIWQLGLRGYRAEGR